MFKTAVDVSVLSPRATARWKKGNLTEFQRRIPKAEHRRIHSMISTNDPSNFLNTGFDPFADTSKVSKQEDLKEISLQLSILRKKHDLNKDSNFHHDSDIARLKKKIENFGQEEAKTITKISEFKCEIEKLENSLTEVQKRQEEALSATKVYKHILERMKNSRTKLDIKNEDFIKNLKTNNRVLVEELECTRKEHESKIKTKKALKTLESFIEKETKEKQEKLETITKDVKIKQENSQKREERYKRQLEIAEAAANEDKDMRETQMREGLMTHRFWYLYLEKRHNSDIQKFASTEEAFQKVRKIVGVKDASEMVTKVLTTQLAYNDLKKTVEDTSGKIEEFEGKIEEIERKIFGIEKLKSQSNMVEVLKKDVIGKLRVISNDKQKMMKLKSVYEKINAWTQRNVKKLVISIGNEGFPEYIVLVKEKVVEYLRNFDKNVKNI